MVTVCHSRAQFWKMKDEVFQLYGGVNHSATTTLSSDANVGLCTKYPQAKKMKSCGQQEHATYKGASLQADISLYPSATGSVRLQEIKL